MVKVSITHPNNAQITVESEESEIIHEILGMVLRDLPRDLMQSADSPNGHAQPDSINGIAQIALETPEPEPEPPIPTPSVSRSPTPVAPLGRSLRRTRSNPQSATAFQSL